MKLPSKDKGAAPAPAPAPAAPSEAALQVELLLTRMGAIFKKIGPELQQIDAIKAEIADITLKSGEGKGATKTLVMPDETVVKVAPRTKYLMTQEGYQSMLEEWDEDRVDAAMALVKWEPKLDKRRYNTLAEKDKATIDKYLTTKEGKPALTIKRPGQEEQDDEE